MLGQRGKLLSQGVNSGQSVYPSEEALPRSFCDPAFRMIVSNGMAMAKNLWGWAVSVDRLKAGRRMELWRPRIAIRSVPIRPAVRFDWHSWNGPLLAEVSRADFSVRRVTSFVASDLATGSASADSNANANWCTLDRQ